MFAFIRTEAIMTARSSKKERVADARARVVDVAGACGLLDTGKDGVYDLINRKEVDSYLEGRKRRITVASIDRYIERKVAASADRVERARYPTRATLGP